MKKIITAVLMVLLMQGIAFGESKDVTVTIPSYGVSVNGHDIDIARSQYPVISYEGVTYFPMTYDYLSGIGLDLTYSNESGLTISKRDKVEVFVEDFLGGSNRLGATKKAQVVTFPLVVNGQEIDNSKEDYPVLLFRNITYFPMTWRFAVEEFGWTTEWTNERGLSIHTVESVDMNTVDLVEITSQIIDGRLVDDINYDFKMDSRLVGEWDSVDFVDSPEEFFGFEDLYREGLFIETIEFFSDGQTSFAFDWTYGLILHEGDQTASRYFIEEVNGLDYLFAEWKSGDYSFRHNEPSYYVYKRAGALEVNGTFPSPVIISTEENN